MDALIPLLIGITAVLGLVALGLGGVVLATPDDRPCEGNFRGSGATTPFMLVESDVRAGVRGIFP